MESVSYGSTQVVGSAYPHINTATAVDYWNDVGTTYIKLFCVQGEEESIELKNDSEVDRNDFRCSLDDGASIDDHRR